MNHWLMKSEPDTFGIDDLKARPKQTEPWNGVRNFQARNFIRRMQPGDLAFFYHSSCEVPGVAGICEIVSDPYPDPTQFDPKSDYFDEKSTRENPRWSLVDVKYKRHFKRVVPLSELRENEAKLQGFKLLTAGRLSVMPVTPDHWDFILSLENRR